LWHDLDGVGVAAYQIDTVPCVVSGGHVSLGDDQGRALADNEEHGLGVPKRRPVIGEVATAEFDRPNLAYDCLAGASSFQALARDVGGALRHGVNRLLVQLPQFVRKLRSVERAECPRQLIVVIHVAAASPDHSFFRLELDHQAEHWQRKDIQPSLALIPKQSDPKVIPSEHGLYPHLFALQAELTAVHHIFVRSPI
jgi:hypothetical protein